MSSLNQTLLVFLGGGAGSVSRFAVGQLLRPISTQFPWATLVANVLGSLAIGVLYAVARKNNYSESLINFTAMGFLGGFTTFSTFSNDAFKLFESGSLVTGALYIVGTVALCLLFCWLGYKLVG